MSNHPATEYFAIRALAEHRLAQEARDPRAIAIHEELAARYEALASDPSLDLSGLDQMTRELPMLRSAAR